MMSERNSGRRAATEVGRHYIHRAIQPPPYGETEWDTNTLTSPLDALTLSWCFVSFPESAFQAV